MSNEEAFVNELIDYIFTYPDDDYMTMECLCRKLHKHGLIDKEDGEWRIGNFIEKADTPQTEEQRKVQEAEHRMANIIVDMTPQNERSK